MSAKGKFDLCAFCPELCMDRCAVTAVTGSNAASPHSKMMLGWMLEQGLVQADADLARALFECTGCLACNEACKFRVDVEQALFGLRARLVREGVSPYPREALETPSDRLAEVQAGLVPADLFVPEAQAVLFPGCHALLDSGGRAVTDILDVFRGLGIEFVGASRDAAVCCGYPLWAGGYVDEFADRARRVTAVLRRYRMVVVLSPCCAYTMRTLYAAAGIPNVPRVTLALDLAAPLVVRTAREPLGLDAAYHDSCFLGRHLGSYDMPREVLAHVLGHPPLELRRNRADAPCCGAGGVLDRTHPLVARQAAGRVRAQAADAGARVLVTAGPPCSGHVGQGGDDAAASGVEVTDLIGMVARWLGPRSIEQEGGRRRGRRAHGRAVRGTR